MDDRMSVVVEELQSRLGDDYEVRIVNVTKNNDTVIRCISIRRKDSNLAKIYYWNGESVNTVFESVVNAEVPNIDYEMTLEKQRDKIVAILINKDANRERLECLPHRDVEGLDLAMIYKIIYEKDNDGIVSSDVTNGVMRMLGITEQDLYDIAMENTPRFYAPSISSMTKTLKEMKAEYDDDIYDITETLYILSNDSRQYGAICMLYPDVLKKFCEGKKLEGVFVIPSSVHETLLMIMDKRSADIGYIKRMIREVNKECVSNEEILSYNPYYYDSVTNTICIAE